MLASDKKEMSIIYEYPSKRKNGNVKKKLWKNELHPNLPQRGRKF
jgi:hypothetical protein